MLSFSKTEKLLGRAVDISDENDENHTVNGQNGIVNEEVENMREQRGILLKQAASFLDFERLFAALYSIETWRDEVAKCYE